MTPSHQQYVIVYLGDRSSCSCEGVTQTTFAAGGSLAAALPSASTGMGAIFAPAAAVPVCSSYRDSRPPPRYTRASQDAGQQVEGLLRARGHQHVVRLAGDGPGKRDVPRNRLGGPGRTVRRRLAGEGTQHACRQFQPGREREERLVGHAQLEVEARRRRRRRHERRRLAPERIQPVLRARGIVCGSPLAQLRQRVRDERARPRARLTDVAQSLSSRS